MRCPNPVDGQRRRYCADCRLAARRAAKREHAIKQQAKRRKPCERCGAAKPAGRKHYCDACAALAGKRMKPCRRCGGPKHPGAVFLCAPCVDLAAAEAAAKRLRPTNCQRCGGPRAYGCTRYCDPCASVVRTEKSQAAMAWRHNACECGAPKAKNGTRYCEPCALRAYAAKRARAREYARENPDRYRVHLGTRRARKARAFVEDVVPLVVLERDDGVCGICGGDVDPLDFHVDHVIPLARGGEHSYANVQAAHPSCNLSKGTRMPQEVN